MACGSFLCDDMGLGKSIHGLSVGQVLYNYSELSYLLVEATPDPDGARRGTRSNTHRGNGQAVPSQDAIKRMFSIYCGCREVVRRDPCSIMCLTAYPHCPPSIISRGKASLLLLLLLESPLHLRIWHLAMCPSISLSYAISSRITNNSA
jgi:hypothetical protein